MWKRDVREDGHWDGGKDTEEGDDDSHQNLIFTYVTLSKIKFKKSCQRKVIMVMITEKLSGLRKLFFKDGALFYTHLTSSTQQWDSVDCKMSQTEIV